MPQHDLASQAKDKQYYNCGSGICLKTEEEYDHCNSAGYHEEKACENHLCFQSRRSQFFESYFRVNQTCQDSRQRKYRQKKRQHSGTNKEVSAKDLPENNAQNDKWYQNDNKSLGKMNSDGMHVKIKNKGPFRGDILLVGFKNRFRQSAGRADIFQLVPTNDISAGPASQQSAFHNYPLIKKTRFWNEVYTLHSDLPYAAVIMDLQLIFQQHRLPYYISHVSFSCRTHKTRKAWHPVPLLKNIPLPERKSACPLFLYVRDKIP